MIIPKSVSKGKIEFYEDGKYAETLYGYIYYPYNEQVKWMLCCGYNYNGEYFTKGNERAYVFEVSDNEFDEHYKAEE